MCTLLPVNFTVNVHRFYNSVYDCVVLDMVEGNLYEIYKHAVFMFESIKDQNHYTKIVLAELQQTDAASNTFT